MQDVQNLGKQMQDGFAAESRRRQQDYNKMERGHDRQDGGRLLKRGTSQTTGTKGDNGWIGNEELGQRCWQRTKRYFRKTTARHCYPTQPCLCREGWNSRVGSQTTNNVTKDSRRQTCRISSMTCTRWYLTHTNSTWIGSKPGPNRRRGQPKCLSACGSVMRPTCR